MDIIKRNFVLEAETDEGRVFIGSDIDPVKLGKSNVSNGDTYKSSTYFMVEQDGKKYVVELFSTYYGSEFVGDSYTVYELPTVSIEACD